MQFDTYDRHNINPSRWLGPVSAATHPNVQVNQVFLQIGLILLPPYAIDPGCGSSLEGIKPFRSRSTVRWWRSAVNRTFLSFRAAFRTLASPWDTLSIKLRPVIKVDFMLVL